MPAVPFRFFSLPCLLLLLAIVTGCAVHSPATVSGTPDRALQEQLSAIRHWQLEGKLAVRTPQQAESARVQWRQDGDSFDIRLSGPAGLKATHIYGMPGGVRFEQGERVESAGSAEVLSERLIGWPLPATEMTWWLRGLPASNQPPDAIRYDAGGWLAELEQGDWTIRFSDYRILDGTALPGRIEAGRGDVKITLVIKQWTIGQQP